MSSPETAGNARWSDLLVNEGPQRIGDAWRAWLQRCRRGDTVTFATGYMSIHGLLEIADVLQTLVRRRVAVRLLLGVAPTDTVLIDHLDPEQPDPAELNRLLHQSEEKTLAEINNFPTTEKTTTRLLGLLHLLEGDGLLVRRFERGFLHCKALADAGAGPTRAIAGSANLSLGGMLANHELGLRASPRDAKQVEGFLGDLWNRSADYDLGALIQRRFRCYPHELIYLRMLQAQYGHEVDPVVRLPLLDWQKDGVAKAMAILERIGGVLVADDVGLGKTFIAGEIIRRSRDEQWGPVVVACPARLRKMWEGVLADWQLHATVISHHALINQVRDHPVGTDWPPLGLVVCDEAHRFRDPDRRMNESLRTLLAGQQKPAKIVLLTATPVNNRGDDLYELLSLADAALEPGSDVNGSGRSARVEYRTERAAELLRCCQIAPELPPMQTGRLHADLDQRMVRRTRPFILTNYPSSPIVFPEQIPVAIDFQLDTAGKRLVDSVVAAAHDGDLASPGGASVRTRIPCRLQMAAYLTSAYFGDATARWAESLAAMLRIMLCKRLESSPAALASTVTKMLARTVQALNDLDRGYVRRNDQAVRADLEAAWRALDDDFDGQDERGADELLDRIAEPRTPSGLQRLDDSVDVTQFRFDLTNDRRIFEQLLRDARAAMNTDPKREAAADLLAQCAADPRGPKVIIFSSSRVTTDDLGRWLEERITTDDRLACYRGRMANLGTREKPDPDRVAMVVSQFAPLTAGRPAGAIARTHPPDKYDLLIGTDQIAEGGNFQQAAIIINYDLPWNPQTISQRAGRVDRIGSQHDTVTCYSLLPDGELDKILRLLDRLRTKIEIAGATVGVPHRIFPDVPATPRDFVGLVADLRAGNLYQGTKGAAYIADQRRAWLAQAQRAPDVRDALRQMMAAVGGISKAGSSTEPGFVFCFAHPAGLAKPPVFRYVRDGCEILIRDTARCLDAVYVPLTAWLRQAARDNQLITGLQRMPEHVRARMFPALRLAQADIAREFGIEPDSDKIRLITWLQCA